MQLTAIIAITVPYGKDNDELYTSHAALQRKYHGRKVADAPVLFHNVMAPVGDVYSPVQGIVDNQRLMEDLMKQNGRIGLYWGLHGNVNGSEPTIELVAAATAIFYKCGLRFHRINVSVCFGAGSEKQNPNVVPAELGKYVIGQFCRELTLEVRKVTLNTDPDPLLDLMVAAYRSIIIMYDSATDISEYGETGNDIYMQGGNPTIALAYLEKTRQKFKVDQRLDRPQNALETGNYLVPFSPRGVSVENVKEDLVAIDAQYKKNKGHKKFNAVEFAKNNRGSKKFYGAVVDYIMRKLVLEYEGNGVWIMGTIAKYSLKQTTRELVSLVEPTIPMGPNPDGKGKQVVVTVI